MTTTVRPGRPAVQLPVVALVRLAETAQAVPALVRGGTIDRAAAIALIAIAADQASSRACTCGQGEIARRAGTSQPYLASAALPQLVDAGLVTLGRAGRRITCTVRQDAIRAAAAEGGWQ